MTNPGQEDHDLLIEIRSDVKHIKSWTGTHEATDNERFKEVKDDIEFHKKIIYGCIGVFIFIEIISKLIK